MFFAPHGPFTDFVCQCAAWKDIAQGPAGERLISHGSEPGTPEVLISPPLYVYEHRAAVDLLVEDGDQSARDATFDALKQAVAAALATDRTLGGLCDYALGEAPAPLEIAAEGAEAIKAATVTVVLSYATPDPLT